MLTDPAATTGTYAGFSHPEIRNKYSIVASIAFSVRKPCRITSLNEFPEIRPASLIQAISPDDLIDLNSCSVGARGLYRSSRARKGKYRETLERNRVRGLISSEIEPIVVGKET